MKKFFPATQTSALGDSPRDRPVYYLSLSTNYFSTPPGVCGNKKNPSHFIESGPVENGQDDPRSQNPQLRSTIVGKP